jgi:N-acetylglucosamine-6-phosphate deacetylase
VLGAHVEGPFLNPDHLGAHDGALMLDPTAERLARLLQCPPRMLRLAPELPSAISAVRTLTEAAVLVSARHSGATYEQACAGEAGIRFGMHLYNAMTPLRTASPAWPPPSSQRGA